MQYINYLLFFLWFFRPRQKPGVLIITAFVVLLLQSHTVFVFYMQKNTLVILQLSSFLQLALNKTKRIAQCLLTYLSHIIVPFSHSTTVCVCVHVCVCVCVGFSVFFVSHFERDSLCFFLSVG